MNNPTQPDQKAVAEWMESLGFRYSNIFDTWDKWPNQNNLPSIDESTATFFYQSQQKAMAEARNQWQACKESMPPYDKFVVCRFEYVNKKFGSSYAVLKHVKEDDVRWRTADDDSEFNEMAATVTHWQILV